MSEQQTSVIVDSHGRPVERPIKKKAAPAGTCPDCGAGKEKRQAALGGVSWCMECGHEFEDRR
jgi:uncharacterized protein (DUF983 family)